MFFSEEVVKVVESVKAVQIVKVVKIVEIVETGQIVKGRPLSVRRVPFCVGRPTLPAYGGRSPPYGALNFCNLEP